MPWSSVKEFVFFKDSLRVPTSSVKNLASVVCSFRPNPSVNAQVQAEIQIQTSFISSTALFARQVARFIVLSIMTSDGLKHSCGHLFGSHEDLQYRC